ncbi:hypothetical protein B0O99DRAFT_522082 [Bisporella sp. PMI_857]|nr:hypothetical protein B0O99DRAFT_522082 [Bisporella sp. PMI_857]
MGSSTRSCVGINRGPILVLLSQIFSSLINLCVKVLITKFAQPISPIRILNTRMIITFSLSSVYCWVKNIQDFPGGAKDVRWLMVLRAVGGSCGAIGFYNSLKYLPLAEATVLNLLAPLGCCIVMALLVRGRASKVQIGAAVMSVMGIVITARPAFIFEKPDFVKKITAKDSTLDETRMLTGILFALLGACGGACAYTCIQLIGTRAHPLISVNYFAAMMISVTSISIFLDPGQTTLKYEIVQVALLVAIGIVSFITEFVMTAGLAVERSSSSTQMIFSQILFATVLDWIFWGFLPDLTSVIGGVILIASLAAVLIQQSNETSAQQEQTSGIFSRIRSRWGRKRVYDSNFETFSLDSLLPSETGMGLDED